MSGEDNEFTSPTLRALAPDVAWTREPGPPRRAGEIAATLPREALVLLCAGHFPGAPVVPGAHLLGCLQDLATHLDAAATVVERCMFKSQVVPDAPITVAVWPGAGGRVHGEIRGPGAERPAVVASFVRAP